MLVPFEGPAADELDPAVATPAAGRWASCCPVVGPFCVDTAETGRLLSATLPDNDADDMLGWGANDPLAAGGFEAPPCVRAGLLRFVERLMISLPLTTRLSAAFFRSRVSI